MSDLITTNKPWYVAGQGAIGTMCAANLMRNKHDVHQIIRPDGRSQPLKFIPYNSGSDSLSPVELDIGVAPKDVQQIKNLVIPLKAYQIEPFIDSIKDKISTTANIILSHNGLGTLEYIKQTFIQDENIYFCTTNNGVFKTNQQVVHAGIGPSYWGIIKASGNPKHQLSNADIEQIFPNAQASDNIIQLLWQKLLINCVINPLTAIHNVKNGALADNHYQNHIGLIVKEFVTVAQAYDMAFDYRLSVETVNQVIQLTSANTSSMLQDIQHHRPTEIDYITGYLVTMANKANIDVPTNIKLLQRVKALTR